VTIKDIDFFCDDISKAEVGNFYFDPYDKALYFIYHILSGCKKGKPFSDMDMVFLKHYYDNHYTDRRLYTFTEYIKIRQINTTVFYYSFDTNKHDHYNISS